MLHLASQSPRRRELLARLGCAFTVLDAEVPEERAPGEPPEAYVRRVARDKALAGFARVRGEPQARVIGADTEVVLSAVSLVSADGEWQALSVSEVRFDTLDAAAIDAYVAGDEWQGKAGAYAIQGSAQAFIAHLSGSYSGVMGLPLHETARLLRDAAGGEPA